MDVRLLQLAVSYNITNLQLEKLSDEEEEKKPRKANFLVPKLHIQNHFPRKFRLSSVFASSRSSRMDIQPIVTPQEKRQVTSLTSISIQNSHTLDIANIFPQSNEIVSHDDVSTSCFHGVFMSVVFITLIYPFYRLLKFFLWCSKYCFLLLAIISALGIALGIAGALSSLTFPFLLVSLLLLRLSQFIKKGKDYDKVTEVKMVVEWFVVLNLILLGFGILICSAFAEWILRLKTHIRVQGKPFFDWCYILGATIVIICGIRFILLWIIQNVMPQLTLEYNDSGLKVMQPASDIVDCFLLWLGFVAMNYLPHHETSALATQKCIEIFMIVFVGWNGIALSTHFIVWSVNLLVYRYLDRVHGDREKLNRYAILERFLTVKCLVYFGNGIKRSFNLMLNSLLLLLVWVFYFGSHLKKTDAKAKTVNDFGTWICTVLLILSFLWILKDFVLLSWEANAVYNRLSCKILESRKSLYFLGLLGQPSHDILKLRDDSVKEVNNQYDGEKENKAQITMNKNQNKEDAYKSDEDDDNEIEVTEAGIDGQLNPKLSDKRRTKVKHDLLLPKNNTMTLFNIQQVAQYFVTVANALSNETFTSDILRKLTASDNREILIKLITGKDSLSDANDSALEDWKLFEGLLDLQPSECISQSKVKVWLESSHNKCLFLANTLCSTKDVVGCLNNIISVVLVFASLIFWLIFTGLANTSTLVLVASPLVAATFIFGDTCKTLFQGIIFVYVVHPFDVGDLCVIDEKMMEVKSIGIWKTTFSNIDKVGTYEVMYPNSELAMKTFINHKTEFDWNDLVELDIDHLHTPQVEELMMQIENLLDDKKDESMRGSHSVSVISNGKVSKIVVRFRHNNTDVDMTYFECLKEKDKLRSMFLLDLQNLIAKKGDDN